MEEISNIEEISDGYESRFFEIIKSFVYSTIGIFIFFIPIKIDDQVATLIYHISFNIQNDMGSILKICIVVFSILGSIKSFFDDERKNMILNILRFVSVIILVNIFYGDKSIALISDNTIFLLEEIVLNISTMLPLTAVFMTFLLDYGVLDIVESYFQKFMKKTYKLSGKSIVNILVFLFTDCFCGYFITNSMYKKGKLRESEAVILMANFSIGSIWLLNYICDELNIKKLDLIIISLLMLTLVNIIMCRIYPLNKKKKSYFIKTGYKETVHKKDKFKKGMDKYLNNNCKRNIFKEIINNLEECFQIIIYLIPNIVLVLFLGDILINSGYVIGLISNILSPILTTLKLIDIEELNKFLVVVFYNNIVAIDGVLSSISYNTKLIMGMITLVGCISISSNITYIKFTNISINIKELILIYLQRIALIIGLYCLISYTLIGYFM